MAIQVRRDEPRASARIIDANIEIGVFAFKALRSRWSEVTATEVEVNLILCCWHVDGDRLASFDFELAVHADVIRVWSQYLRALVPRIEAAQHVVADV